MAFVLPPKSQVGYLDPEFANEGVKVHITSEGEFVNYDILPPKPIFPDLSEVKSLKRYFAPKPYRAWPAWLYYHPKNGEKPEPDRLVKNADEAAQLGVCYREASIDERGRYGVSHVWDYADDSPWRSKPYKVVNFDPSMPGHGKAYTPSAPNPLHAQHELVAAVAAAVAKTLQVSAPSAPAHVDQKQWDEFLKFQAWQKSQEAVATLVKAAEVDEPGEDILSSLSDDELKAQLIEAGESRGIKIKKHWSIERIKAELDKAA